MVSQLVILEGGGERRKKQTQWEEGQEVAPALPLSPARASWTRCRLPLAASSFYPSTPQPNCPSWFSLGVRKDPKHLGII